MNMHERFERLDGLSVSAPGAAWLGSFRSWLAAWLTHWADYYAAAAAYDDLSRLSDAQLKHRGLSRDILARDLGEWHG